MAPKTGASLRQILSKISDPVTAAEAAAILKVRPAAIRRWVALNKLPGKRWGVHYILSRKIVVEFIKHRPKRGRPRKDSLWRDL